MSSATTRIGELLKRDLSEPIEEIIKLEQANEQAVFREIEEYVATRRIRDHYRALLRAIADGPAEPDERVGIWISGFFGSGKSSFAKLLGYTLANRTVMGHAAAELFKGRMEDDGIARLVDSINTRIPTEVIMFDVSVSRAQRRTTEKMAEIMYSVLLNRLGYASEDYDIAELEIELEGRGRLAEFERVCRDKFEQDWERARIASSRMNYASAILHEMDPRLYPQADSWARSLGGKSADITVAKLVDRAFELTARRRPGKALAFIIDEVGQYVARSADRVDDLRAVVERFGQESKNRVQRHAAPAPIWVAVTSQEKLEEVVAAIDSKRVELARLQDRFHHRVDLAPADIREVATRRVLAKRPEAEPELRKLYAGIQGQLNVACHLEGTSRRSEVGEEDFVQFYPYLPHYIELCIDIVSGIRVSQPGAPQHLGGSNRTIIKQAHAMLVSPRTRVADERVGRLVTLDQVYELVEGNLSSEKQKDISDIAERFKGTAQDGGWEARVAKAICLLELVRDLPRTAENVAAVLVDGLGRPAPLAETRGALERLEQAQFVRRTEEGYKLQTAQEKRWDGERRDRDPKPLERNEITRKIAQAIFAEPSLRSYRYHDLRTFRVGLSLDGVRLEEGQIPLALLAAESADVRGEEGLAAKQAIALSESRAAAHKDELIWVFALTPEVHHYVEQVFASHWMIAKYGQEAAQGRLAGELVALLEAEKREEARLKQRLREKMEEAIAGGRGYFRGVARDASTLGRTVPEIFRALFEAHVPDLYPRLEMGVRRLRGNEADEVLKAANLTALPPVFYGGEGGLELVVKEGAQYVPNRNAPVAKEMLDALKREHSYGNRVTGRDLEARFGGMPYGWEPEVIRLVVALLLRAGLVEVTYQGRRYRNAQDPQSRTPLVNAGAFRTASFTPRESIDLKTLTAAVRGYEALTGEEVDVEEGAIAEALKKLADEEVRDLLPVRARLSAHRLPGLEALEDYYQTLTGIQAAGSDDCVRILSGEGASLKEARERARRVREATTPENIAAMERARRTLGQQWPALQAHGADEGALADYAAQLGEALDQPEWYRELPRIRTLAEAIGGAYATGYSQAHDERHERFARAIDEVKNRPEWVALTDPAREAELEPLRTRVVEALRTRACAEQAALGEAALTCTHCAATLSQMESDVAALEGLRAQAVVRLREVTAAPSPTGEAPRAVKRVRAADYFVDALESEEGVKRAVEALRDELVKLVTQGASVIVE